MKNSKLENEKRNLKFLKIDLERHMNNETLNGSDWDRIYNILFDSVEAAERDIVRLENFKKLGKFFDLWA